jgi:hypothetical protein
MRWTVNFTDLVLGFLELLPRRTSESIRLAQFWFLFLMAIFEQTATEIVHALTVFSESKLVKHILTGGTLFFLTVEAKFCFLEQFHYKGLNLLVLVDDEGSLDVVAVFHLSQFA